MKRVQRKKGYKMPANTIYVDHPSKWANPFSIEDLGAEEAVKRFRECILNPAICYTYIDEIEATIQYERFKWMAENLDQLRGYDLACFCSIVDKNDDYTPCHADVLIDLTNK